MMVSVGGTGEGIDSLSGGRALGDGIGGSTLGDTASSTSSRICAITKMRSCTVYMYILVQWLSGWIKATMRGLL